MTKIILIGVLTSALTSTGAHAAITSHWTSGESKGVQAFNVNAKNGVELSVNCDSSGNRDLFITIPGKHEWVTPDKNKIQLHLGEDSYPIEALGTNYGDSWWFNLWKDAAESDEKVMTIFVDSKETASVTLKGFKQLYSSQDAMDCLRR
ncbi:hypothetical protein DBY68_016685 [Pseudocitrobacter sp. RIT415]|uniref:hypothetical protein n=1 Tax=Pseudocitrobacter sp. RIT415 TaxID=2202163 RepID=UPI000D36E97E|nr:hypothetical protein [Pseudocitrobacter sp. RIT 415]RAU45257.1 hypothetical protein DBY68_016685 [Pseudocitrobacter sp. RIT 415]